MDAYYKEIEFRVTFLRKMYEMLSWNLNIKHIQYLYEYLVLESIYEKESDIFFNLFNSIMYSKKVDNSFSIINDEVINFIFEHILMTISC